MTTGLRMLVTLVLLATLTGFAQAQEGDVEMGTDPRDFATKFMPYYRYTELENGLEQKELVLFGLIPLSKKTAITYEVPLGYERDIKETSLYDPGTGGCSPGEIPGGGIPLPGDLPSPLEGDCKETGIGDMNMRVFTRLGSGLGGDWLTGVQVNFPIASEEVLGSETLSMAPMLIYVKDLKAYPAPGAFVAGMNFYQFDLFKDSNRPDQSMYIGRWFVMLPLSKKFQLYALPEFQPIYDFENSHFSFWAGPEFGKMFTAGNIVYLKPGFGVSPDSDEGDRDVSFEIGWRKFL
jgi:hypothetical protein